MQHAPESATLGRVQQACAFADAPARSRESGTHPQRATAGRTRAAARKAIPSSRAIAASRRETRTH